MAWKEKGICMEHNYCYKVEEICLRPFSLVDSENYRQLRNREDNRRWFKTDAVIAQEAQEKWYHNYLLKTSEYMFAVEENETGKFLGAVGLYDVDLETKSAEIGRIIIDRYIVGGKGYAAKALEAACRIAIEQLGLRRIYAEIYSDNVASLRSFRKIGFAEIAEIQETNGYKIIRVEKDRWD